MLDEPSAHHHLGDSATAPAGTTIQDGVGLVKLYGSRSRVRYLPGGMDLEPGRALRELFLTRDPRMLPRGDYRSEGDFRLLVSDMQEGPLARLAFGTQDRRLCGGKGRHFRGGRSRRPTRSLGPHLVYGNREDRRSYDGSIVESLRQSGNRARGSHLEGGGKNT